MAHTLVLAQRTRCSPTVTADPLTPLDERADAPPAPGPVSDADATQTPRDANATQEGERGAARLLDRKVKSGVTCCGAVTRYLVRWRGHMSADDERLRAEELVHRPEMVSECECEAHEEFSMKEVMPRAGSAVPMSHGLCDGETGLRCTDESAV